MGQPVSLQRVGNRYGIDIDLEPAPVRWLGQSVRFAVQPRNLLEPAWDCVIRDAAGKPVFSKSMANGRAGLPGLDAAAAGEIHSSACRPGL